MDNSLQFFEELLGYNSHTNEQLFNHLIADDASISDYTNKAICHILAAHDIWNNRIKGSKSEYEVWPKIEKTVWLHANKEIHQETKELLSGSNFTDIIHYTDSVGDNHQNSIKDILFHVVNHSNYHRAQIAKDMRDLGQEPLPTDYIFYKR